MIRLAITRSWIKASNLSIVQTTLYLFDRPASGVCGRDRYRSPGEPSSWRGQDHAISIAFHWHLENFRAPGRTSCLEDGIGASNRTREQLLNAQSTRKLRPRKSAQVYRAKDADIATQTRGFVGALDACRTDPPAACIARAKFINHIDDHGSVSLI